MHSTLCNCLLFSLAAGITFCSFSEGWFTRVGAAWLSKFSTFRNTFSVFQRYPWLLFFVSHGFTQVGAAWLIQILKNDSIIKTKSVILKKMFMDNQTIIGVSALAVFLLTYYFWLHKRKRK